MKSRASSISFGLFVLVVLAALYSLLAGHGRTNWGLVTVLGGILLLRAVMFVMNLRRQRRNVLRGRGSVKIETRLGLNDEPPHPSATQNDIATTSAGAASGEPSDSGEGPDPTEQ